MRKDKIKKILKNLRCDLIIVVDTTVKLTVKKLIADAYSKWLADSPL